MNKILSIFLVGAMMLSLTACEKRDEASEPSSSSQSSSEPSSSSEPEKKPSSSSEATEIKDAHLTEMYFDYFAQNSFISVLLMSDTSDGLSDQSIGAYAISYLIANNSSYDFEKGSKLSDFDAVTQKYFGKKITNYENDLITLNPDNHIGSTGWGYTSSDLVLKDIKDNADGTKTAIFYMVANPMEGPDLQTRKASLLKGDFYGYDNIKEVEITFEEMVDETRSMYLKIISMKNLGDTKNPDKVYGN